MSVKLTEQERKTVIDRLINNSTCCWDEGDRTTLNTLDDKTLAKIDASTETNEDDEEDPNETNEGELGADTDSDVAVKEEPTKEGDAQADGNVAPEGETDPKPTANTLSAQDKADLAFARKYRMDQRSQLVKVITANTSNHFTQKQLERMSDEALANIAALAKRSAPVANESMIRPNFFGQQGTATLNASLEEEEPLQLGKINYKELAAGN